MGNGSLAHTIRTVWIDVGTPQRLMELDQMVRDQR